MGGILDDKVEGKCPTVDAWLLRTAESRNSDVVLNQEGTVSAREKPQGWGFVFTFQLRLAQNKTPPNIFLYFS